MTVTDIVNCCKTRDEGCENCPVSTECTVLMNFLENATPNMLPDILEADY